jgi:hypothetical protein
MKEIKKKSLFFISMTIAAKFVLFLDSFHQTSSNFVGISTVVCGNFWGLKKFKMAAIAMAMATAPKIVQPIPIFLAYLVPLDEDVTGNITAKIWEVWSEFNIFCTYGGRCHGNQGAKIVKFIPNFKKLYCNVSCHMQIC